MAERGIVVDAIEKASGLSDAKNRARANNVDVGTC